MTELIIAIRAHQWLAALIIAIPLAIGLAKLALKNSAIAKWAAGLPSWVRWGAANLASGATVFVALISTGVPLADAILGGVLAALGVEGVFSAQKHARSAASSWARKYLTPTALLLFLSSCSLLQSEPAQSAVGAVDALCKDTLLRSDLIAERALAAGILPSGYQAWVDTVCAMVPVVQAIQNASLARESKEVAALKALEAEGVLE